MNIIKNIVFSAGEKVGMTATPVGLDELYKQLMIKLEAQVTHFVYQNEKGELREAFGTLDTDLIPSKKQLHTDEMFELLKKAWSNSAKPNEAMGDLITKIEAGHKPARSHGVGTQIYYDLDRQAFRSFRKDKLIAVY